MFSNFQIPVLIINFINLDMVDSNEFLEIDLKSGSSNRKCFISKSHLISSLKFDDLIFM